MNDNPPPVTRSGLSPQLPARTCRPTAPRLPSHLVGPVFGRDRVERAREDLSTRVARQPHRAARAHLSESTRQWTEVTDIFFEDRS